MSHQPTADPGASLQAQRHPMPGYPRVYVGPAGHLAAERARLRALTWTAFDVQPIGATVGAELQGIDLSTASTTALDEVAQALTDYKVIFFRDQPMTPEDHVRVARHFGELELHPFIPGNPTQPELVHFEKGADVGGYENGWHHDVTWRVAPSRCAMLRAISVPASGGDTLFSDGNAAWEGLPEATRELVAERYAIHDFSLAFGHNLSDADRSEMRATYPPARHPIVAAHPETGRPHLFVNRYFTETIDGMSREEALPLLDELCAAFEVPEYQCRFHWTPNAVAIWDNRAVQHLACSDYWPDVRIMERASVIGTPPIAAFG